MATTKQEGAPPSFYAKRIDEHTVEALLPWPPSVNHYWGKEIMLPAEYEISRNIGTDGFYRWLKRNSRAKEYLTQEAKDFRTIVGLLVNVGKCGVGFKASLSMVMRVYPPDRRRRDLSNLYKAVEDALEAAGVFVNDEQIVEHHSKKMVETVKGGAIMVRIQSLVTKAEGK